MDMFCDSFDGNVCVFTSQNGQQTVLDGPSDLIYYDHVSTAVLIWQ